MAASCKITVLTSLYNCESFLPGFFLQLSKIRQPDNLELLLLHNEPTSQELAIINENISLYPFVKHIVIPQREGLYATWNRGIKLAEGDYICIWNVDDIRFPESFQWQSELLDKYPDVAIAYGDMWISKEYGSDNLSPINNVDWSLNRREFLRSYYISCFQMWRKSIHETIGYYDEQFKCSADFDFQIRAALHYPFMKTTEPLGIYLEGLPHKISSNGLQELENNIVYLRYGVYDKINLSNLSLSKKKYNKRELLFFGEWKPFSEKIPFGPLYKMKGICISILKLPIELLRRTIKFFFR